MRRHLVALRAFPGGPDTAMPPIVKSTRSKRRRAGRCIVNGSGIDYEVVFRALPGPVALLTTDLVYAEVNDSFLTMTGRTRGQVVGHYIFDVFPDNPGDPDASGMRNLFASLRRVAETGERDTMALQRYDVVDPSRPGVWEERYWSPVNTPVFDEDGKVVLILHRVEEVTELMRARDRAGGADGDRARVLEAELYTRARELQELNERLRRAHAREHEVALSLQAAMLPAPGPLGERSAAVRYRPAVGALNVCGDWYDLAELPGDRLAVAVGDVVGHGLAAAGVMGQLRSALSAASRVADGPARALDVLGLYARSVEGAESTTAFLAVIDWSDHTLAYSSAGHPPRPCSTRTARWNSWTVRPTLRSAPAPSPWPARRRPRPSPPGRASSSIPTDWSSVATRTSTRACADSPHPSPATTAPARNPSRTRSWPT